MLTVRIEFPKGFLTLRTKKAEDLVEHHLTEGTFWDFVAILVEEKAEDKVEVQLAEMQNIIKMIQSQIASGNLGGATVSNNTSLPSPNVFGDDASKSTVKPRVADLDLNLLGDMKQMFARAKKMEGE